MKIPALVLLASAALLLPAAARPRNAYVVTNTNDSGVGSLRQAITDANANAGPDTITFNIGSALPKRIQPLTNFPQIIGQLTIDATTDPAYGVGAPAVEISGASLGGTGVGFYFNPAASGSIVRGFCFFSLGFNAIAADSTFTVESCRFGYDQAGNEYNTANYGVAITANNSMVGGVAAAQRNVFGPVLGAAVAINGDNNTVQGNTFGLKPGGLVVMAGTMQTGVDVGANHNGCLIGGTGAGMGNVFANCGSGVTITSANAVVQGNRFGMLVDGTPAGLMGAGVFSQAGFTQVGGTVAGARNYFTNATTGVYCFSFNATVQGNYFGTDLAGTATPGGLSIGIRVGSIGSGTVIGGASAAARNLIAGCGTGILSAADGVSIRGNYIGTDVTGTLPLPNSLYGIDVTGGSPTIGGLAAGEGNVISGTTGPGIQVELAATGSVIQGNWIGTDVTGTASIPNYDGIVVLGGGVQIGDFADPAGRNIIAGNNGNGISLMASSATATIHGNLIGLDSTGTAPLPNLGTGIDAAGANHVIGALSATATNYISANGGDGIRLSGSGIAVQGNQIGMTTTPGVTLGNALEGITAGGSANVIVVNTIVASGVEGVVVTGTAIAIQQNSIYDNGGMGIDLLPLGPGVNDPLDTDGGPNGQQNTPVILRSVSDGGQTVIDGVLHSTPNTDFQIELFDLDGFAPDPTGYGPGPTFDDLLAVRTDANGDTTFRITLAYELGAVPVTATATSDVTGTSEFARNVDTTTGPAADVMELLYPTTAAAVGVSTSPFVSGGIAFSDAGIAQVEWSNALTGGRGTATGTGTWSAAVPLGAGANPLTFTARTLTGAMQTDTITVTYTPLSGDVTAPVLTVTTPSTSTFETGGNVLFLDGTASDGVGVGTVTWSVSPANRTGTATGTLDWSAVVPLGAGTNTVTVTVYDTSGNSASEVVTVTVSSGGGTGGTTYVISKKDSCGLLGIEPLLVLGLLALARKRRGYSSSTSQ